MSPQIYHPAIFFLVSAKHLFIERFVVKLGFWTLSALLSFLAVPVGTAAGLMAFPGTAIWLWVPDAENQHQDAGRDQ